MATFSTQRALHILNELPEEEAEVGTIAMFQNHLGRLMDSKGT